MIISMNTVDKDSLDMIHHKMKLEEPPPKWI